MSSTTHGSAQDFIRALKASSDPPHTGSPSKIKLAQNAWDDNGFYLPNKGEVIVEWLLTRFLKDKARASDVNPIMDTRYWQLLSDIVYSSNRTQADLTGSARTIKSWLLPILSRVPIAPIVIAFLSLLSSIEHDAQLVLNKLVSRSIAVLWPIAVPKFSPETLLECLAAVLSHLAALQFTRLNETVESLGAIPLSIVSAYRTAFANSSNKRKIYSTFLQNHLLYWIHGMHLNTGDGAHLQEAVAGIYAAGVETMFGVDVLRSLEEGKCDPALKNALAGTLAPNASTLDVLPRLLRSFIQSVRRHKTALFSQGSNRATDNVVAQVQGAGTAFYAMCDELVTRAGNIEPMRIWETRIKCLAIVEEERLHSVGNDPLTQILRENGDTALEALRGSWEEQHAQRVDAAMEIISVLTRIDYDIVSPTLPSIWKRLILVPNPTPPVLTYLDLLLSYHSKTRSVNTIISLWLDSFSMQNLQAGPDDARKAFGLVNSSALFSFTFLDRLTKAIHGFLTPGQVQDVTKLVLQYLRDTFKEFKEQDKRFTADEGSGARKKSRRSGTTVSVDGHPNPELAAVTFASAARAVGLVVGSLPLHIIPEEACEEIRSLVGDVHSHVIPHALKGSYKAMEAADRRETWAWQIVAAAALRVHYELSTARVLKLELGSDSSATSQLRIFLQHDGTVPEFSVEIARFLLYQVSSDPDQASSVFDNVLHYLERHLDNETSWSGKTHRLTPEAGHKQGAIAIFHLLLTRWLPLFDLKASTEQMSRLTNLMLRVLSADECQQGSQGVNAANFMRRMLHDAAFWELPNVRDVFMTQIAIQTASVDQVDVEHLLSYPERKSVHADIATSVPLYATYKTLLHAPAEYLSRSARADFLQRARIADVIMSRPEQQQTEPRLLLVVREFMRRTFMHMGSVEHQGALLFFHHLVKTRLSAEFDDPSLNEFVSVTLDVITMYMSAFLKAAQRGDEDAVVSIVEAFSRFLEIPREQTTGAFQELCLLRFIETLTENYEASQFNERVLSLLQRLYERMSTTSCSRMLAVLSTSAASDLYHHIDTLKAWSRTLAAGRWLQKEVSDHAKFGRALLSRLFSKSHLSHSVETWLAVLDIVLEELYASGNGDGNTGLENVVATYIAAAHTLDLDALTPLHVRLFTRCRTLSLEDFTYILNYIYEALSCATSQVEDTAALIRLSSLLVHDAPEGTSKITQDHTTKIFNLFADKHLYHTTPSLRREVLNLMSRHFNSRPAAIRICDMSSIWSIVGQTLEESTEHDAETDSAVFHELIAIVSALIRLRRDLVLNTLPHLGMILRQLTKALRCLRPQLGAKQTKQVVNTLPRWITARTPLGVEESKALARLMTNLSTKTVVRAHAQSADIQKPESLVRPFSKHAAYVLTAYVEAISDPLCHVSAQVRKELQPGLFALCDMLGEHNRDAMMVSALDAGGKATMKALWKEYEKQRYVGKG